VERNYLVEANFAQNAVWLFNKVFKITPMVTTFLQTKMRKFSLTVVKVLDTLFKKYNPTPTAILGGSSWGQKEF
jgi:hypothetical protein